MGVDLAKQVIQVHAVDSAGQRVTSRALARDKFIAWCAQLPPGCLVAMEASSSAHHWARRLIAMGLYARIIEDASNELGGLARLALQRAWAQWQELDAHLAWCDERIAVHLKADAQAHQAEQLMGVGPVTASALVASVGDFKQFRNGAQFGAWLGLVPRQNSSGGKNNLGAITKRGDM